MNNARSTAEVAKAIGISKKTLLRWLWGGKLSEPKQAVNMGRVDARVWSAADLERARKFKEEHYRKRS
jgi:predicted site-specific integrase-resolvase